MTLAACHAAGRKTMAPYQATGDSGPACVRAGRAVAASSTAIVVA